MFSHQPAGRLDNDGLIEKDFFGIPHTWSWLHVAKEIYGVRLPLAADGERYAAGIGSVAGNADNWLIAPEVTISGSTILTYHIGIFDPQWASNFGESYSILVGPVGASIDEFEEIYTERIFPYEFLWQERTIDLSAYAGTSVRIAFRHFTDLPSYIIQLDNVRIGDPNSPLPTLPATPENLTFVTQGLMLQWDDLSNNETGFQLQIATDPFGPWQAVELVDADLTTLAIHDLQPDEHYYFRVRAYNDVGTSNWSNTAEADNVVTSAEGSLKNELILYPNPTDDGRFSIDFGTTCENECEYHVVIRDIYGRTILAENIPGIKPTIELRDARKGLYFVTVHHDAQNKTIKLLVR